MIWELALNSAFVMKRKLVLLYWLITVGAQ